MSTADEQEEDVIVVTGPAVIDPFAVDEDSFSGAPVESGVSAVSRQALMDALDDTFIFTDFLKDHGVPYTDRDGVYAVCSMQQLAEWQPLLSRGVLYNLAAAGVSIWDYSNTYVEPTVFVGAGTELLPGTVLRGTTSIADGCTIGPNSYLENVKVGEGRRSTPRRSTIPRSAATRRSGPLPMSVRARGLAATCAAAILWRSRTPPSATARRSRT